MVFKNPKVIFLREGVEVLARLRIKVRLDYMSHGKTGKFGFGGKHVEQAADEIRQQKVTMLRNVPLQAIHIEDIDMSQEIYTVFDDIKNKPVAYAPVMITFLSDSIEETLKFFMQEEFRTVEILEPEEFTLKKVEMEKLFFKIGEELKNYKEYLEKKNENWK